MHKRATKPIAAEFLRNLIKILPHTVLTDNGIQFTNQKRHKYAFQHIFDRVCKEHNIEHRLTKILGKLNETLKNTTTNYISNSQSIFMTLSWLTIMQRDSKLLMVLLLLNLYVLSAPELFILNPYHHTLGLYILYGFSKILSTEPRRKWH